MKTTNVSDRQEHAIAMIPTAELLRELLSYDPETGILTWLHRGDDGGRGFNAKHAGHRAGTAHARGYRAFRLSDERLLEHHVIWIIMTGAAVPDGFEIDHINRNRSDNRWANLRLANRTENHWNKRGWSKVGMPKGVFRHRKRFSAQIKVRENRIHLGTFDTPAEAAAAYRCAELRYFGVFARVE